MSATTGFVPCEMTRELVRQMRANDTYGQNDRLPDEEIIAPYIVTKEQKHEIPLVGDPDEETLDRVKAYYNAIAVIIEARTGLMGLPVVNLTHEGFGRALITVGKLVVYDRTLRDVHRYGYNSVEHLQSEANKALDGILALIAKYREVAEL